jgi:hypothetical protein
MSRIPVSPQIANAPAPLPTVNPIASSQTAEQISAAKNGTLPATPASSSTTDQMALEKKGGSMSHYNLGLDAASPTDPVTVPVTDTEVQWALGLEEKVVKGYQPSAEEFEKYTDIATRLSDCNPARQMEESEDIAVKTPQKLEPGAVSDAELKWALRLEERVQQGYQPTAEDIAAYEKIYAQMTAQEDIPSKIPKEDLSWAQDLMAKVGQGYQPTAEEIQRYDTLYAEAQQAIQAKHQSPEGASVAWAKDLEAKVTQGYQPSESEVKRYTKIFESLQQDIK